MITWPSRRASGSPSSAHSATLPTARATTRSQPRAGPARRRGPRRVRAARSMSIPVSRRGDRGGRLQERGLLGDRVDQRGALRGQRHGQRQTRKAAAAAHVEQRQVRRARSRAAPALPASASRTWPRATSLGRAQTGQVDVFVPGEKQPGVILDRGSLASAASSANSAVRSERRPGRLEQSGARIARQLVDIAWERSPWERGPISDVHARTPLNRCAVPAPIGVTFPTPPAFQFSPADRLI